MFDKIFHEYFSILIEYFIFKYINSEYTAIRYCYSFLKQKFYEA